MKVTPEMIQAVNEHECSISGHNYDVIQTYSNEPKIILCNRCGRSWPVAAQSSSTSPTSAG